MGRVVISLSITISKLFKFSPSHLSVIFITFSKRGFWLGLGFRVRVGLESFKCYIYYFFQARFLGHFQKKMRSTRRCYKRSQILIAWRHNGQLRERIWPDYYMYYNVYQLNCLFSWLEHFSIPNRWKNDFDWLEHLAIQVKMELGDWNLLRLHWQQLHLRLDWSLLHSTQLSCFCELCTMWLGPMCNKLDMRPKSVFHQRRMLLLVLNSSSPRSICRHPAQLNCIKLSRN